MGFTFSAVRGLSLRGLGLFKLHFGVFAIGNGAESQPPRVGWKIPDTPTPTIYTIYPCIGFDLQPTKLWHFKVNICYYVQNL